MKRYFSAVLAVIIAFTASFPFSAIAQETAEQLDTQSQQVQLASQMTIAKGCEFYINANNCKNASFTSSNEKIAAVDSNGRITAKKCGDAQITAVGEYNGTAVSAVFDVRVKISSLYKENADKAELKNLVSNNKDLAIASSVVLREKQKTSMSVNGSQDYTVNYKSSDASVADVNENGAITAKKAGKAVIYSYVTQNGFKIGFARHITVLSVNKCEAVTKKQRNKFYSTSAFIGSSIGVGQKMYFDSQGKGYLGDPLMLVVGCYSFNNDKRGLAKYKVKYKGTPMMAKDAIYKSGVDKVFISMGTNDMMQRGDRVAERYIDYLKGIRKKNPDVVIFIESTTGVHKGRERGNLNSKNIDLMNKCMEKYCAGQKDIYYVDVSTVMKDKDGRLKSSCCSDGYVHLTMKGYSLWMQELTDYTDDLMIKQQKAADAVDTAKESKLDDDYKTAKKLVNKLEKSTVKSKLNKKLSV